MEFTVDDLTQVVAHMAQLASTEDGWINLIPKINDNGERPTSLAFFTLFSGGGGGVTMCTWVPGSHSRRRVIRPRLGIAHGTGHRVFAELRSLAVPIPKSWFVEQDHPRRGLVLQVPSDESHEQALGWALRAVNVLTAPGPISRWRADIYTPTTS